ncbi:alpha/beta hydrolase [Kitasatospora sp. McL0602]|uniref:alpha/beta hydrolase n=1 Tax=Kitasatospora sp. McL0602 TaxID=3439530 RepID=UPI003F8C87EC
MGTRIRRAVAGAVLALAAVGGVGGWAVGQGQAAAVGVPGAGVAWTSDTTLGVRLPEPGVTAPAEVAEFFAGLPLGRQDALAVRHPLVVGNLDGAPVPLRYRANQLALAEERERELTRAAGPGLTAQERADALGRAERYASLAGRQILAFDPRGHGLVAEVFGELTAGRPTAVVVPGADIDLMSFDRTQDPYGAPAGMARALRQATGDRLPVIAWAGYTTPHGIGLDLATSDLAEAGGARLTRFLDGLAVPATLFCHSYGSVVCGHATLHPGRTTTAVVSLGSPGMDLDRAADLPVPLWAAERNSADWIGDVPNVSVLGLGHGADPTGRGFGARVVSAAGAHGHSGYFAPGTASLANFAAIALDEPALVRCAATSQECRDAH